MTNIKVSGVSYILKQAKKNLEALKLPTQFAQKSVICYLSAIMFGLPLIVTDGFYNITETKSVYFYVCTIIFLGAVFLFYKPEKASTGKLLDKAEKRPLTTLDITVAVWGCINLLSCLLSEYQADVWLGGRARYQGFMTMLLYILMYYVVTRHFAHPQIFLLASVSAFAVVGVLGILNCFDIDILGFYRVLSPGNKANYISTIGNINFYSSYFCLLLPLVVCGFCQSKLKLSRFVYTLVLIIGAFGMMVTASESFALGFTCSMLLIPVFFFNDAEKLKNFLISIIIIIAASQIYSYIYTAYGEANVPISKLISVFMRPYITLPLIGACFIAYFLVSRLSDKLTVLRNIYIAILAFAVLFVIALFIIANVSSLGRFDKYFRITSQWGTYRGEIWIYCLNKFKGYNLKEILFGVGPESLQNITGTITLHRGKSLDQAHNEYLQHLMTTGVFGLLSYLSVIGGVIYVMVKRLKDNTLAVSIFAALVSYWVQALVNLAQPFTTPIMYVYVASIGGIYLNEKRKAMKLNECNKSK